MAFIGMRTPMVAPIATEPVGALPTYSELAILGRGISANLTINFASGQLYADDVLSEDVNEFVSANVEIGVDDIPDEVACVIFGCKVTTPESGGIKEMSYNDGDQAPYCGYGYIRISILNNVRKFVAYFYPKVKFKLGNENATTKNNSITWQTPTATATVYRANNGDWRQKCVADTEEAAAAWLKGKLGDAKEAA